MKRRFALSKEQIEELSHSRKENGTETERQSNGEISPCYEKNAYSDNKQVPNGFKNTSHSDNDKNGVTAMEVATETSEDSKEGLKREAAGDRPGRPERPTQLSLASSVGGFGFASSPSSPPSLAPSPSGQPAASIQPTNQPTLVV